MALLQLIKLIKAAESGKSLSALPKDFQPSLMDMWILNQLAHTVGR